MGPPLPDNNLLLMHHLLRTSLTPPPEAWTMRIDEIKLWCRCGQRLRAPLRLQGKPVQCPMCGTVQSVPPDEQGLVGLDFPAIRRLLR